MILLRLFMYLLKPSTERLRKRTNGAFKRMCIRLYQSILRCLLKNYRHYAISDTISLDGGRIKIIHEFRDLKFENELVRNGIDVHPHLLSREMFILPTPKVIVLVVSNISNGKILKVSILTIKSCLSNTMIHFR